MNVGCQKKEEAFLLPLFEMGRDYYFTLLAICFGLASSVLRACISRMPSRYAALIQSCFTVCGREKERENFTRNPIGR
jgi:hypothetical protein